MKPWILMNRLPGLAKVQSLAMSPPLKVAPAPVIQKRKQPSIE